MKQKYVAFLHIGLIALMWQGSEAFVLAKSDLEVKPRLESVRLEPQDITLRGLRASQRLLVMGRYSDGLERDVTSQSQVSLAGPGIAEMVEGAKIVAVADGQGSVKASFGGLSARTAVRVDGSNEKRPFSFARDLGAIFTKRGCNNSDCHGSVKGKGGLKLSANALYPKDDHKWIVEGGTYQVLSAESAGPKIARVNLKEPEQSLLLQKPTMSLPHGGGQRFSKDSADYAVILNWVRSGAPYGDTAAEENVRIEKVEVFPREVVLDAQGAQQLLVTAQFSNGQREDITDQVLYQSNNSDVVEVSETGRVRARKTGETAVLIRTAGHALSATFGVIEKPVSNYPVIARNNFIDDSIFTKLRKYNILPSGLSSDGEFLRRICLDVTGTLPPPERVREFLSSRDSRKRDKLIETLLTSPEYVDYWSFRFGDLLRVTFTTQNSPKMAKVYEEWVRSSIAQNKPYDQMARERIAAQGYAAPARHFYRYTELMVPQEIMAEQVRVFLGRRLDCAQCHNHPYETWSQDQFWGLTAFFGRVTELRDSSLVIDDPGGGHVDQKEGARVIHPRTKVEVEPRFLDGRPLDKGQRIDPRLQLAEWMTANPYFAEAAVNRLWSYFFGRGIVEPVDDFRTTNPPTHPELLAALASDFREHGYDLKRLIRLIVRSRAYQLSGTANETNQNDRSNYSRALPRPLEAAVLLDAISRVTGVEEDFELHKSAGEGAPPPGTRAVSVIPELCPSQFLDVFGRSMRKTPPSGSPPTDLAQALHMWAGQTYTQKISKEGGQLDRLLKGGVSVRQSIEEFYLAALTRFPTAEERASLEEFIGQRSGRRETWEGFVWALLSSREFAFNH